MLKRFVRRFSVQSSEEIRHALANNIPVVSLESTIITHGLPFPQNYDMATRVESELRKNGVIPATTAFINGVPRVGLSSAEIEQLANATNINKVSRRDISYVMANKLHGGTTISGSMILSHKAGIRVFATGGLGGVHRDGQNTLDVSADLDELGRTPVAVVCAGPKSILDIERTMEYLETKGVPVITYGPQGTNVPGFYTKDSGVRSAYNFQDFDTAANIINAGNSLNLGSGYLFCIPPPDSVALDSDFINGVIEEANFEALKMGIKGKELTPFLLSKIAKATKGVSVKSNVEFVLNNAKAAAQIAVRLSKLQDTTDHEQPPQKDIIYKASKVQKVKQHNSVVVGAVALDTYCLTKEVKDHDSNPSKIDSSLGGVGYNVALESFKAGNQSMKFISAIGNDITGSKIETEIPIDNALDKIDGKTSQYISFHDDEGELIIAAANMDIMESLSPKFVQEEILKSKPAYVLLDSNISVNLMEKIIDLSQHMNFKLIVEPTSFAKASKLGKVNHIAKPLFLITPTVAELDALYDSFDEQGKFDLDYWFPIIDQLSVDGQFRSILEKSKIKHLLEKGIFQKAVSLLPYSENVIIKDGPRGVYHLSIHADIDSVERSKLASTSIRSRGNNSVGVLLEHYKATEILDKVTNVTGAGDTLAGVILKEVLDNDFTTDRSRIIAKAQHAAIDKITA